MPSNFLIRAGNFPVSTVVMGYGVACCIGSFNNGGNAITVAIVIGDARIIGQPFADRILAGNPNLVLCGRNHADKAEAVQRRLEVEAPGSRLGLPYAGHGGDAGPPPSIEGAILQRKRDPELPVGPFNGRTRNLRLSGHVR